MKHIVTIIILLSSSALCMINEQDLEAACNLRQALYEKNIKKAEQILITYPNAVHASFKNSIHTNIMHTATDLQTAKLLLKYGADVDVRNKHGETLLDLLCYSHDSCDEALPHYLVKHGADVNNSDNNGNSLLHRIMYSWDHRSDTIEKLRLILKLGGNVYAKNSEGETVLVSALKFTATSSFRKRSLLPVLTQVNVWLIPPTNNELHDVALLLKNDAYRFTTLIQCAPHSRAIRNMENRMGNLFAFINACEEDTSRTDRACTKYGNNGWILDRPSFDLLYHIVGEKSGVVTVKNHFNQYCSQALDAIQKKPKELCTMLKKHPFIINYNTHTYHRLFSFLINHLPHDMVTASCMLQQLADTNRINPYTGNTLLHMSAEANNSDIIPYLIGFIYELRFKDSIDFTTKNKAGNTALSVAKALKHKQWIKVFYSILGKMLPRIDHKAVFWKHVKLFLKNECDINKQDHHGKTFFMRSISKHQRGDHTFFQSFLLQKGAKINIRDNNRRTPLLRALFYNRPTIVEYLLQQGAFVPRHVSRITNNTISLKMLKEAAAQQTCCICYERHKNMGDIPCRNIHRNTFICRQCYRNIAAKTNDCPLCRGQLSTYKRA